MLWFWFLLWYVYVRSGSAGIMPPRFGCEMADDVVSCCYLVSVGSSDAVAEFLGTLVQAARCVGVCIMSGGVCTLLSSAVLELTLWRLCVRDALMCGPGSSGLLLWPHVTPCGLRCGLGGD